MLAVARSDSAMAAVREELKALQAQQRGKGKRRPPVSVNFDPGLEMEVEEAARRNGITKSDIIRLGTRRLLKELAALGNDASAGTGGPENGE